MKSTCLAEFRAAALRAACRSIALVILERVRHMEW